MAFRGASIYFQKNFRRPASMSYFRIESSRVKFEKESFLLTQNHSIIKWTLLWSSQGKTMWEVSTAINIKDCTAMT